MKQLFEYHHVADSAGEAAALALRSGHRRRAAAHRVLLDRPASRDRPRSRRDGRRRQRRGTRARPRSSGSGSFDRPYVDEATPAAARPHAGAARPRAADRRRLAGAAGERRHPAARPGAPPHRRDRARTPHRPASMLGDYSYITHVESLIEVLRSGNNVFAMPIDHGVDVDEHTDLGHVTNVFDELRAAAPGRRGPLRRGLHGHGHRSRRLRRGRRARGRERRRRHGDGRSVGPHRRLHDGREPRRRVARPARRAGGTRARRGRDRHAGRARDRGRPTDRLARGARRSPPPC